MSAPDAAPAAHPGAGRRRVPVAAVVRRALPALGTLLVVALLGGVALRIGASNLEIAERTRFESRIRTIDALAENTEDISDPSALVGLVRSTPFTPADAETNRTFLAAFRTTDGPHGVIALVARDGTTIASLPEGRSIDVVALGSAWSEAMSGRPATSDTFAIDGRTANATVVPVGEGSPWAAVVDVEVAEGSPGQSFFEQVGSLNGEPGGFVVVDREGRAFNGWSAERLGEQVVTPEELASLGAGLVRSWTAERDGVEHSFAGIRLDGGYALVFEQSTDLLYGDLRDAERGRSRTLILLVVIAVGGLGGIQLLRERAARREEARVQALMRNSHDLVLVVSPSGELTFVSPAVEGLLGHASARWVGRRLTDLVRPTHRGRIGDLLADPGSGPLHDVELQHADGAFRWFDIEARDLAADAHVAGTLLTCQEVGARKALQDELLHQSTHDRLTGLPNRPLLSARLEDLLASGPHRPFALLYVDLDRFKPVNDTLGHDAGDAVLETVARRLESVAGEGGWAARLGGDEFAVVADGRDEAGARQLASHLRDAVRAPIAVGTNLVHIDASVGIVVVPPHGHSPSADQLIRIGDEAMYAAKRQGRGAVASAEPTSLIAPPPAAVAVRRSTASGDQDPPVPEADDASDPRPAAVQPIGTGPSFGRRVVGGLPLLVAVALVGIVGFVGFRQTEDRRMVAERERVEHQLRFATRAAGFYSDAYDADHLAGSAAAAPWALDGGQVDAAILEAFATSQRVGRGAVALLRAPDGTVLASHPPGLTPTVTPEHPAWAEVLAGESHQLASVADPDVPRSYYLLPVPGDGGVDAVLALGLSLREGPGQAALEQGGTSGYPNGGWSMLQADGTAYVSWNPDLVGETFADPEELRQIPRGEAANLTADGTFVAVSPMTSSYDPTYLAFAVPEEEFLADLRVGLTRRDLSYLGVIAATILALVVANHRRERAVRRSEERLTALLRHAHDLILVLDRRGDVRFISSAVEHLLGYPPGFRIGSGLIDLIHPDDRERAVALLKDAHRHGVATTSDIRVRDVDGRWRWFDLHGSDLHEHPEVGGLLLTCRDVTVRRELQERLRARSLRDPLTGLANRRRLTEALQTVAEWSDERFAVLFVDLDDFKPVNDALGHDAGDEVLRVIARRFERNVRAREDGRPEDLVCRLGGDEFAILLRDVDEPRARQVAQRLTDAAAEPIDLGVQEVRVSASVGVALSHPAGEDPSAAVQRADQAMYRAKSTSPGSYSFTAV